MALHLLLGRLAGPAGHRGGRADVPINRSEEVVVRGQHTHQREHLGMQQQPFNVERLEEPVKTDFPDAAPVVGLARVLRDPFEELGEGRIGTVAEEAVLRPARLERRHVDALP